MCEGTFEVKEILNKKKRKIFQKKEKENKEMNK